MATEHDNEFLDDDDPTGKLARIILATISLNHGELSPMQHIIALGYAITNIAYTIDIQAQDIMAHAQTNDFMREAANQAGFSATSKVEELQWDIADTVLPPLCTRCEELAPPIEISTASNPGQGFCPRCQTRYTVNIVGEPTQ